MLLGGAVGRSSTGVWGRTRVRGRFVLLPRLGGAVGETSTGVWSCALVRGRFVLLLRLGGAVGRSSTGVWGRTRVRGRFVLLLRLGGAVGGTSTGVWSCALVRGRFVPRRRSGRRPPAIRQSSREKIPTPPLDSHGRVGPRNASLPVPFGPVSEPVKKAVRWQRRSGSYETRPRMTCIALGRWAIMRIRARGGGPCRDRIHGASRHLQHGQPSSHTGEQPGARGQAPVPLNRSASQNATQRHQMHPLCDKISCHCLNMPIGSS